MPLNDHQKRQVVDWFNHRVGPMVCPVCAHTEFKIDTELTLLPVWLAAPQGHADFTDGVAAVMVTCGNCAHLRLYSAAKMGLTPTLTRPTSSHGA